MATTSSSKYLPWTRLCALALSGLALGAALAGCGSNAVGGPIPVDDDAGVDGGAVAVDGGSAGSDGGRADGGVVFNPADPDRDSDCDGLTDAEELSTIYAGRKKTDPLNPDTDGDGIPDGVEVGRVVSPDPRCTNFVGDADPTTTTNPTNPDTDGDGIPDGVEDANHNGRVDPGETDPNKRDTDNDTVPDGLDRCPLVVGPPSNNGCPVTTGVDDGGVVTPPLDSDGDGLSDDDERNIYGTDPHNPDTDGDGLSDGDEVRIYHTNPLRKDTDCDGLTDGEEVLTYHTNPLNPDTDGDGLPDGLEVGVTVNPDPVNCPHVKLDLCPQSHTDPLRADTDGDGCSDGVEDANQNGCVDAATPTSFAERDPNVAGDCSGVQQTACSAAGLQAVTFKNETSYNVQTARVPAFSEVRDLTVNGQKVGALFYDPTHGVGAFVLAKTATAGDIIEEEAATRAAFDQSGGVALPVVQSYTTWDGFAARRASYDWNGAADLKTKLNDLVARLLGSPAGLAGGFADTGPVGPHRVRVEVVRRSATAAVVLGAVAPQSAFDALQDIRLQDLANGSALADGYDENSVQCDRFASTEPPKVDFLWIIDNSGSMGDDQAALAAAAQAMASQLASARINWRIATAYTDSDRPSSHGTCQGAPGPGRAVVCPFTTDINLFRNGSSQCAYSRAGTCGSGTERALAGAAAAINVFRNGTGCEPVTGGACNLRSDAQLVVIFLSDTGDQTTAGPSGQPDNTVDSWARFFRNYTGGVGAAARAAIVDGIVCPSRTNIASADGGIASGPCTDDLANLPLYDRIPQVISLMGGVEGSVRASDQAQLPSTIRSILNSVIGAVSTLRLSKPPISATLKVVVGRADGGAETIVRNPDTGFDYDGVANTLTLFGAAVPDAAGREVAVSYRYWNDRQAPPASQCPSSCTPPLTCDAASGSCQCPFDCGSPAPSPRHTCDRQACQWKCSGDCNGQCGQYQTCSQDLCACQCQQAVTCAPGFRFNGTLCDCVCDTEALGCDQARFDVDLAQCTCTCKTDCGGCSASSPCNPASCRCVPR